MVPLNLDCHRPPWKYRKLNQRHQFFSFGLQQPPSGIKQLLSCWCLEIFHKLCEWSRWSYICIFCVFSKAIMLQVPLWASPSLIWLGLPTTVDLLSLHTFFSYTTLMTYFCKSFTKYYIKIPLEYYFMYWALVVLQLSSRKDLLTAYRFTTFWD